MTANNPLTPRKNVLTEADLEALRELLAEHPCRYPFTPEQAATLAGVANNIQTAQSISFKVIVTAIVVTVLGFVTKGLIQSLYTALKAGVGLAK